MDRTVVTCHTVIVSKEHIEKAGTMSANTRSINHDNIVTRMINHSNDNQNFFLHADIIPTEMEDAYEFMTGEKITKRDLDGGTVYQVGTSKFFYGMGMRSHPAMRFLPVVNNF